MSGRLAVYYNVLHTRFVLMKSMLHTSTTRLARIGILGTVLLPGAIYWSNATPNTSVPPAKIRYNRDIRPILAENCFACHGPDSAARKADLRIDRPADAFIMRNGRAPIVKGKPEASEIIKRVTGVGPVMPPAATHKTLTPQQIKMLKLWVSQGAEYERHWSYISPVRPALPAVKNMAWVKNPIDRFILAKLEAKGLTPAPEADKRTLIRRLSLDLTGLPPAPDEVENFVNDKSPDAYEKLVDKFMAKPEWGEHRGRYWLDVARYADTHGIHIDNFREIWAYREWVVQAFNANKTFDQFTIEQLAGDLLPKPTLEQKIATGFNRCNITSSEGGAIDEEYLVLYARDRTETASQVWLGTTAGCAVCHDHKFDPLSQKEFYSLSAFFNNTTQAAMDGNVKDTPPIIQVPLMADRPRWETIQAEIVEAKKATETRKTVARGDFEKWLYTNEANPVAGTIPTKGLQFHARLSEGKDNTPKAVLKGTTLDFKTAGTLGWEAGHTASNTYRRQAGNTVETPDAGDFEKSQAFTCSVWVKTTNGAGAVVARMDDQSDYRGWDLWLEGGKVGTHIVNKWPSDALKVVSKEPMELGKWQHLCFTYDGGAKPDSVRVYINGVLKPTDTQSDTLKNTIRTKVPFKVGQRHTTAGLDGAAIQDVRLYDRVLSGTEVSTLATGTRAAWLMSKSADTLSVVEKDELFSWWLTGSDEDYRRLLASYTRLQEEESAIRARGTIAHVANEKMDAAQAFILFRGEYDKRRDKVLAATPAILPAMPASYPKNRLGFAKWLLLPEHPLTTRVTVNRFWQEVFGIGFVKTAGDFGVNGEIPTHPELLDWLAVEFREKGWDVKRFFKLLVTSATYRQACITTPAKRQKDPLNRLLSRGARFRMDAEMVRDYVLASSGLLSRKMGGASVKPYQPDGVWEAVAMIGSNTRDYRRDSGEGLYRRSMYTFWKRSAPPASMDIFNAPSREFCTVRRERTNTPLQALVTMNDDQCVEAARTLAQHALKEGGTTFASRLNYITLRLVARPLRANEVSIVAKSLRDLATYYKANPKDAKALLMVGESKADASLAPEPLAAWTMLTNQLMNLDEVLNK